MQFNRIFLLISALLVSSLSFPVYGAVQASVTIDQISSSTYGKWTLISADGSSRSSNDPGVHKTGFSIGLTDFGPLTLSVVPPAGMISKITIYRGGVILSSQEQQQYSVTLYPNDNYRFLIQYSLSKLGKLGITSEPSGVKFRMKGPTSRTYNGKTPITLDNIPAGKYTLVFSPPEKCIQPAPHNAVVEPEKRNTIHQTFNCNAQIETGSGTTNRKSKRDLRKEAEDRESKPIGQRK